MLAECLVSALAEQVHTAHCLICLSILPWENKQSVRLKIYLCNREAFNAWVLEAYRALMLILIQSMQGTGLEDLQISGCPDGLGMVEI